MKKLFLILLCFTFGLTAYSQSPDAVKYIGAIGDEDWTRLWVNYKPNTIDYYATDVELSGIISQNTTLTKKHTYLLKGTVYVADNATLTIEAGTIIRGDINTCGTLLITQGSKINAVGSETAPIIFTSNMSSGSRNAGDWGGVVILGNAPTNKIGDVDALDWGFDHKYSFYGGLNEDDDSGVMKYVRIEYPGHKISKSVELNGLTLGGVGRKTKIENLQVSYSDDDSVELFGGTVVLKNIVSYKCGDDDFDFNFGYRGMLQYALAIRHPLISDFSGSRCIEADSYKGSANTMNASKLTTTFTVSNMTLVTLDIEDTPKSVVREAIFVGPDCNVSVLNSIISGFQTGIVFTDSNILDKSTKNVIKFSKNVINNCDKPFSCVNSERELTNYFINSGFYNSNKSFRTRDLFVEADNPSLYDFKIKNAQVEALINPIR